jgi:RNA polymerase sigma-70 factor (ECF subfamily)
MSGKQPGNEDFQLWWQQCLSGDTQSLGQIHASLFDGLYSYARKLLNDDAQASDAIQELFIRVWQKRSTIGPINRVKPYFFTLLRRQLLNQLRDKRRQLIAIPLLPQPDIEFSQEEIHIREDHEQDMKQRILQVLNTLPRKQREIIYLHFFEDMSLTQISEVMNIRYQSVQNLKQRAIQNLRSSDLLPVLLVLLALHYNAL